MGKADGLFSGKKSRAIVWRSPRNASEGPARATHGQRRPTRSLAVESKHVVQLGKRRHMLDAAMGARRVVGLQPWFERSDPFGRGCVGLGVGPFAQVGLDEALG